MAALLGTEGLAKRRTSDIAELVGSVRDGVIVVTRPSVDAGYPDVPSGATSDCPPIGRNSKEAPTERLTECVGLFSYIDVLSSTLGL